MGARTRQLYIDRLAESSPMVQIHGETLTGDIPEHCAFRHIAKTYADLYDLQHVPELRDANDLRVAQLGGPSRDLLHGAAHRRGPRQARVDDEDLGPTAARGCWAGGLTTSTAP
jgi:pyridoxal biosynthesis lyase PdxS